jgi:hypothetical protein
LARHWRCMISSLLAFAIGSSGKAKNSDVVYIQCEVCKRAIKVPICDVKAHSRRAGRL